MTGALTGQERFGVVNIVQVGGMVLFQTVPLLIAFLIGPQLNIIIPAAVVYRCAVLVPLFFAVKKVLLLTSRPRVDRRRARELLGYGAWVSVTNIVGPILSTFDRFVIGVILGAASVAYYDVPSRLAQKASIVPGALSQALFPRLSAQTRGEATATSLLAARAVNGFMTPLVVVVILLVDPFLTVWVGADFARHAAPVGATLLAGIWINSVATIPYAKLQAEGHPNWVAMAHVAEVLPYLAGLWWALQQFGLVGAALVWTARVALDAALLLWIAHMGRALLAPLTASAGLVCAAWGLTVVRIPQLEMVSAAIVIVAASGGWGLTSSPLLQSSIVKTWRAVRTPNAHAVLAVTKSTQSESVALRNSMRNEK
jgi:O-antigen/teichoic acid export membrane protein